MEKINFASVVIPKPADRILLNLQLEFYESLRSRWLRDILIRKHDNYKEIIRLLNIRKYNRKLKRRELLSKRKRNRR